MSDSPQKKRPAKAPLRGPNPRRPAPPADPVVDRRKVVFGLGFGVVAAAGARHLDTFEVSSVSTTSTTETTSPSAVVDDQDESADASTAVAGVGAPQTSGALEAPVLDSSKRLEAGQTADVVFTGARIIDPETGFDRIGNLALIGSTIVEISDQPIPATREIPATDLVVSPGFIDMLSYSPNEYGEWWKVADGVTTNVGMHGLRFDAQDFYEDWTETGVPINFGGAVHNSYVRSQPDLELDPTSTASATQIAKIAQAVEAQVREGYLGIHVQPEYAPGVGDIELMAMGTLAAKLEVPLCVHARYSDNFEPGLQSEATAELVKVARETGCHVHVEHLNSTGGTGRMAAALDEISAAIAEGLRMTTCMYPYEFWATYLKANRYNNWQEKYGLTFDDLQVAGTNERLTAETYAAALDANALTAAFAIPSSDNDLAVQAPFMMIGSDAILERPHNNHPRSTGSFSRTIAEYARNKGLVSLSDALAMMTIRPARLLGISSPQMNRKGRLQIGADADITVFDPLTIADRSTIENPAIESVGVKYVYVNGVEVRNLNGNVNTATPGIAIRSDRA